MKKYIILFVAIIIIAVAAFLFINQKKHEVLIHIQNNTFTPQEVSISAGTTVTWINDDDIAHTITSARLKPLFDQKLNPNETFNYTFAQDGIYSYTDKSRPAVNGVIRVKAKTD